MIATARISVRSSVRSFHLEVLSRGLAAICHQLVLHVLAFIERGQPRLLDRRDVDEHILAAAAALGLNEPVTLGRVEPFHCAGRHSRRLLEEVSAQLRLQPPSKPFPYKSQLRSVLTRPIRA